MARHLAMPQRLDRRHVITSTITLTVTPAVKAVTMTMAMTPMKLQRMTSGVGTIITRTRSMCITVLLSCIYVHSVQFIPSCVDLILISGCTHDRWSASSGLSSACVDSLVVCVQYRVREGPQLAA